MADKILYTASRSSHIENFHGHYLDEYKQRGFEVHTVTEGKVSLSSVCKSISMPFAKNIFSPLNAITLLKLACVIRHEQYSIISSHATLAGLITRLAARMVRSKATIIHTCHGYLFCDDNSTKAKISIFLERLFAKSTGLLIVMNAEDYEIAQKYHLGKRIVFTHGMGLDTGKFPTVQSDKLHEIRCNMGITEGDFVFLCVGEFSSRKNQEVIIRVFATASKESNIKLLFAGDGKFLADCQQLAQELGCSNNVYFLGHISELNEMYRISDAVVSASRSEGLPFNIMESLYCGVPVIASKVKGHIDLIEHEKNGVLFPVDNAEILADYLRLFADYKSFYSALKSGASLDKKYFLENAQCENISAYKSVEKVANDNLLCK